MKYTKFVDRKFKKDGEVIGFYGNTIICFLNNPDSTIYQELDWAQDELKKLPFSYKYGIIPKSTFHMTVLSLLNQGHQNTKFWTHLLDDDCEISQVDRKFKNIYVLVKKPESFKMKIDYCNDYRFSLSPYDEATRLSLKMYRDKISEKTGVRFDSHESYTFHITLFYKLIELTPKEEKDLKPVLARINKRLKERIDSFYTGEPSFVIFNDMCGYYEDLSMRCEMQNYRL